MKKKRFPLGKVFLLLVVAVIAGGGFWLSMEPPVTQQPVEKPVELKLTPLS